MLLIFLKTFDCFGMHWSRRNIRYNSRERCVIISFEWICCETNETWFIDNIERRIFQLSKKSCLSNIKIDVGGFCLFWNKRTNWCFRSLWYNTYFTQLILTYKCQWNFMFVRINKASLTSLPLTGEASWWGQSGAGWGERIGS